MTHASIALHRDAVVGPVRRRTFGAFVEHLGRSVYGGIYEPGHPHADAEGFRLDVIDLVRELGSTTIRYPGGNFVSGYRWEDGVGPRDKRPRRLDLAWHSVETNEIGTDEFVRWCRLAGQEPMMAVNLGTRGVEEALQLLEYSNHPSGTELSDQRIANGSPDPHGIRFWCLGNEMDGPWQIGARSASDYGTLAARTASAMRMYDSELELVVCGSSGSWMPTFGEWERVVLEQCYEQVDYISCHAYYQERDGDIGSFLASSLNMESFIGTVASAIDLVKATKRSEKSVKISFDEWNVWYIDDHDDSSPPSRPWPKAPHLLEDNYTVTDAVVVGGLLITLLKNSDIVTSASLAQLVNVIAPIMTEPGGLAWRQTTFHPFAATSRLASGDVIRPVIECETYATAKYGDAPLVDSVATVDSETGRVSVFIINRATTSETTVSVDLGELKVTTVAEAISLHDEDPYARNNAQTPDRVVPQPNTSATLSDGTLLVTLPPVSWTAISLA